MHVQSLLRRGKIPNFLPRTRGGQIRALLALGIAGIIAYNGYLYVSNHVAIDSRLNAERVGIPAQIDGVLTASLPTRGTRVHAGQVLGEIENSRVDNRTLTEITERLAVTNTQLRANDQLRVTLEADRDRLVDQADRHRALETERMVALKAEQTAALESARRSAAEADIDFERANKLLANGFVSRATFDAKRFARDRARAEIQRLEAAVRKSGADVEAARQGYALNDTYSDVSYTRQRLNDIALKLADLASEHERLVAAVDALNRRHGEESARVQALRDQVLVSPVDGVVWDVHVPGHAEVIRGTTLIDLVDCHHVFAEATIYERFANRIEIGEMATIKPLGGDERWTGRVRAVMGSAANWDDNDKAVVSMRKNPGEARVILDLLRDTPPDAGRMCEVGRLTKVTFSGRLFSAQGGAKTPASPTARIVGRLDRLPSTAQELAHR